MGRCRHAQADLCYQLSHLGRGDLPTPFIKRNDPVLTSLMLSVWIASTSRGQGNGLNAMLAQMHAGLVLHMLAYNVVSWQDWCRAIRQPSYNATARVCLSSSNSDAPVMLAYTACCESVAEGSVISHVAVGSDIA